MNVKAPDGLADFYRRNRTMIWAIVILSPFVIVLLGVIFDPHQFWDEFIYRYFWAPVVSDKEGHTVNGIPEGYNTVSTIVYALLLGLGLVLTYKILRKLDVKVDTLFILSCIPIFLYGGTARTLEDAALFHGNVQFVFISPLIYFMIIGLFLLLLAVGYLIRESGWNKVGRTAVFGTIALFIAMVHIVVTWLYPWDFSFILEPLVLIALAALSTAVFYITEERIGPMNASLLSVGLLIVSVSVLYLAAFTLLPDWQMIYQIDNSTIIHPHPYELLIIPGVAAALTLGIWIVARSFKIAVLTLPVSLLLFFAQFVDGAATYRGMELYGYSEKHVVPNFMIDLFGTALVMLLFKFILVLLVIIVIDILFEKELKTYPRLVTLMKFVVVFLGLAPGTRDMVRIALGV